MQAKITIPFGLREKLPPYFFARAAKTVLTKTALTAAEERAPLMAEASKRAITWRNLPKI